MRPVLLFAMLAAGVLIAGCGGGGDRTFEAEELVAELNDRGAGLKLGEKLTSGSPDVETYALGLEGGEADVHGGGGSISVEPSVAEAESQLVNCRRAISIVCFRAANVILIFESEASPFALKAVEDAVLALGEE